MDDRRSGGGDQEAHVERSPRPWGHRVPQLDDSPRCGGRSTGPATRVRTTVPRSYGDGGGTVADGRRSSPLEKLQVAFGYEGKGGAMETIPVAILGSGNIGTDLLYKLKRSRFLKPTVMAGIVPDSEGLARARNEGLTTTAEGIEGLLGHAKLFDIVFEATTASAHVRHAPLLQKAGKIAIDLTPAAVG